MITRKNFLKKSLAIGVGITMPESLFSSIIVPQKKEKLGVALVGLGYYSTDLLAPALQMTQHCELKGVVSGTPSKRRAPESMVTGTMCSHNSSISPADKY